VLVVEVLIVLNILYMTKLLYLPYEGVVPSGIIFLRGLSLG
jgi:hypothetical protein